MNNSIKLFGLISGLASVNRFSMVQLARNENVLEHTGMVALICYQLHRQLLQRGVTLSLGVILKSAVVHDLDEIVTGDIPRPTKYASKQIHSEFISLEHQGMKAICQHLENEHLLSDHAEAKLYDEGAVVALADLIAVVYKIWEEVLLRSNMNMIRQAKTVLGYLDKFRKERKIENILLLEFVHQLLDEQREIIVAVLGFEHTLHGLMPEELFNGN